MTIDIKIARGLDLQIEPAVPRHQVQHVIEKADAGGILVLAFAVERQRDLNLRFGSPPIDYRFAACPP